MQKDTDHDRNAPTGRKNRFCARRMAAWRCEAERLAFDVLVVGGTASSGSLRKNMLRTAMVRTIAVVMTVSEICGHGRFAMTPEDFNSHRREAEAFLLHCWGEGERKRHASSFCAFSRAS